MFLKRLEDLFNTIFEEKNIPLISLLGWILFGALIFGATVGAYSGGIMFVYAAIKIFLVMASTTLICLPSMFLFVFVIGLDLSFKQISKLILTNIYLLSILLFAFVPVIWFGQNFYDNYRFNVLMLVLVYSIAWFMTIINTWKFLKERLEKVQVFKMLVVWCIVFAFVSTQMIWIYRPWVGYTYIEETLPFIRPLEGDIYSAVVITFKTWIERSL